MSLKEFEHIVDKETNPKGNSNNGQTSRKRKMQTQEHHEVENDNPLTSVIDNTSKSVLESVQPCCYPEVIDWNPNVVIEYSQSRCNGCKMIEWKREVVEYTQSSCSCCEGGEKKNTAVSSRDSTSFTSPGGDFGLAATGNGPTGSTPCSTLAKPAGFGNGFDRSAATI